MANDTKTYELTVMPREITGKASKQLRRDGMMPAVVYGHNVQGESVQVPLRDMERVYLRAGSNSLIDLRVSGGAARKVFIHNIQRDPVTHTLIHADFMAVNLLEEITTTVHLVLVGESPIVDRNEGMLLHALELIQVRALPMDLPPVIEVDISGLDEVDQAIHVSDLTIPGNVTVLTSGEELVAKISALRVEEVEEVEEGAEEGAEAEEGSEAGDNDES